MAVPEPPAVDDLVARYAEPTAVLDSGAAQRVAESLVPDVATWSAVSGLTVVPDALLGLQRQLEDEAAGDPPSLLDDPFAGVPPQTADAGLQDRRRGNGFLRIELRCPGIPDDPAAITRLGDAPLEAPDGGDGGGEISLTATLDRLRVLPVVWGLFEDCQFQDQVLGDVVPVRLDGAIRFYLGPQGLDFRDVRAPDALVDLRLDRFDVGDIAVRRAFDFRLKRTGALEVRADVGGGTHVFLVIDAGGAILGVRDAISEWLCDFDAGVCTAPGRDDLVF